VIVTTHDVDVTAPAACTERKVMRRRMLKSKIHRATVTGADLHYVGSISLDRELLELADIRAYEQVTVLDVDNGARFETYALPGERHEVTLNGAAARLVAPGDRVIVLAYGDYEESELDSFEPIVIHVDDANAPVEASRIPEGRRYVEFSAPSA
jgi:aspartate 1-decarboxylase